MDTATDEVVRWVSLAPNRHWIAFTAADSDYDAGTITLIDGVRSGVIDSVPVGKNPGTAAGHRTGFCT